MEMKPGQNTCLWENKVRDPTSISSCPTKQWKNREEIASNLLLIYHPSKWKRRLLSTMYQAWPPAGNPSSALEAMVTPILIPEEKRARSCCSSNDLCCCLYWCVQALLQNFAQWREITCCLYPAFTLLSALPSLLSLVFVKIYRINFVGSLQPWVMFCNNRNPCVIGQTQQRVLQRACYIFWPMLCTPWMAFIPSVTMGIKPKGVSFWRIFSNKSHLGGELSFPATLQENPNHGA